MSEPGWLENVLYPLVKHHVTLLTVGGAAGTHARYWVGTWVRSFPWASGYPFLGTLLINVTGSFVLGLALYLFEEAIPPEHRWMLLLIGTGFCGAFTTFSTFECETFDLVRNGSWGLALAYVMASVGGGFAAVLAAVGLGNVLFPRL